MLRITVLLIALSITGLQAQTKNFIDQPYLETTAQVDTLVVPDKIYLSIHISEKDTKDRTSVEELENRMQSKLKQLGIDTKKQLSLGSLSSNFRDYFLRKTGVLKSKYYSLLVYDALSAGQVIQGLESVGIANVNFQKAEVSNLEELKIMLRGKAVAKAATHAKVMVEPLGQSVNKALFISDMNTGITYGWRGQNRMQEMSMAKADGFEPIDVDFQKVKVSSTVNVKFAID